MTKLYFTCACPTPVNINETLDNIADLIANSGYDHYGFEDIKYKFANGSQAITGYALVSRELARKLAEENVLTFRNEALTLKFDITEQKIGDDDITYIAENRVAKMSVRELREYVEQDLVMYLSEKSDNFWREFISLSRQCEVTLNSKD